MLTAGSFGLAGTLPPSSSTDPWRDERSARSPQRPGWAGLGQPRARPRSRPRARPTHRELWGRVSQTDSGSRLAVGDSVTHWEIPQNPRPLGSPLKAAGNSPLTVGKDTGAWLWYRTVETQFHKNRSPVCLLPHWPPDTCRVRAGAGTWGRDAGRGRRGGQAGLHEVGGTSAPNGGGNARGRAQP